MTSKTCGCTITQFDIDVMGYLRSVTLPDSTQIRYLIDGANRRIGKLRNNVLEKSAKDAAGFSGGLNTYGYVSNDPLNKVDLNGEAEVCSRALDGTAGIKVGIARHDQIWYDDGSNSGFFADDRVRPDYIDENDPSQGEHSKDEYGSCKYIGSDSDTRAAEERVKKTADMDWTTLNNCQGYVSKVTNDSQLTDARIKPVGGVYTRKKP